MKKLITFIIVLSLIFTLSVPMLNAEETSELEGHRIVSDDGVILTAQTDKEVYAEGEDVFLKYSIQNDSEYDLCQVITYHTNNFVVEATISDGTHTFSIPKPSGVFPSMSYPTLESKKRYDASEIHFNFLEEADVFPAGIYTISLEFAYLLDCKNPLPVNDGSSFNELSEKLKLEFEIEVTKDGMRDTKAPSAYHTVENYGITLTAWTDKDEYEVDEEIVLSYKVHNQNGNDIMQLSPIEGIILFANAKRLATQFKGPYDSSVLLTATPFYLGNGFCYTDDYDTSPILPIGSIDSEERGLRLVCDSENSEPGYYKLTAYLDIFVKNDSLGYVTATGSTSAYDDLIPVSIPIHFDIPVVAKKTTDLSVSATNPTAATLNHGDSTKYTCTIRNSGEVAAKGDISVEFYRNNVLVDTVYITDSIPVDGSKVVVSDKIARESFGMNSLRVIINSDNNINENNYANNTLKTRYSVKDE